jgi:hypothetical protein
MRHPLIKLKKAGRAAHHAQRMATLRFALVRFRGVVALYGALWCVEELSGRAVDFHSMSAGAAVACLIRNSLILSDCIGAKTQEGSINSGKATN